MSARQMKELREQAKLTQTEMADRMGLGISAYQDLENDDPDWKKFKRRHLLALERASLTLAVERGDINLALPAVRRDAIDLARLISGELAPYQVLARFSDRTARAGCGSPSDAYAAGKAFFDASASSVVITHDHKSYSLDQFRGAFGLSTYTLDNVI